MSPTPNEIAAHLTVVRLQEWQTVGPKELPALADVTLSDSRHLELVQRLSGRLDIQRTFDGLSITSSSYVGRVDVGPLRIVIEPKLQGVPLTRLLGYAYGLSDLAIERHTSADVAVGGIVELVISMLVAEAEQLLTLGPVARYVKHEEVLASPRGTLLISEIARNGGLKEARLPCRHHARSRDWHLNAVVKAGLQWAIQISTRGPLSHRLGTLLKRLNDVTTLPHLSRHDVANARSQLTRETAIYENVLILTDLLLEARGFSFEHQHHKSAIPGFMFDMNAFFQRLLSRFLRENLRGMHIVDEQKIRGVLSYVKAFNPQGLRAPSPRPDYALYDGERLLTYLDAKYRDIWLRRLPAQWLYQLSIYALASPTRVAILLHPSQGGAHESQIALTPPIRLGMHGDARVIVRPVDLKRLSTLLAPGEKSAALRAEMAQALITQSCDR